MATKVIAWNTGTGNITLNYTGQGNGTIIISSDPNNLFASRSQTITISTTSGSVVTSNITINQAAKTVPNGVYIETTDGNLYTYTAWNNQGTVNAIVVINNSFKRRIFVVTSYSTGQLMTSYSVSGVDACTDRDDGSINTTILRSLGSNGPALSASTFTVGGTTYLPAIDELTTLLSYKTQINYCRTALSLAAMPTGATDYFWSSTYYGVDSQGRNRFLNNAGNGNPRNTYYYLKIGKYE